jgi:hypothetical protein
MEQMAFVREEDSIKISILDVDHNLTHGKPIVKHYFFEKDGQCLPLTLGKIRLK